MTNLSLPARSLILTGLTLMYLGVACLPGSAQTQPAQSAFSESTGANLPVQKIGPNDLLFVAVYDEPEFTRTIRVGADGQIILPMMKHAVMAAGLLPAELEARIADALRREDLLTEPSVTVTIAEYQSRPVTVTGAVKNPLSFQAIGQVTLMDAITRAGGLSPEAGSEILVSRSQGAAPLVRRIPAKALVEGSDPKLNLILEGGEEVRVPEAGRFFVLGNVKTNGSFPIQDRADTTVMGALTLAGGFAGPAPKEAWIIRLDDATQTKHPIPIRIKAIVNRKTSDIPLVAHDILFVPTNKTTDTLSALAKIIGVGATSGILINLAK